MGETQEIPLGGPWHRLEESVEWILCRMGSLLLMINIGSGLMCMWQ